MPQTLDLTAGTSLHTVDEFKRLSIKQKDGAIVRLEDVANVVLGAENYDFTTAFGGRSEAPTKGKCFVPWLRWRLASGPLPAAARDRDARRGIGIPLPLRKDNGRRGPPMQ